MSATSPTHTSRLDNEGRLYDAVLIASFGGPEGPNDVMPFLENVLRGRDVPEARKLEVARHYKLFGGVSPINEQNRTLVKFLRQELDDANVHIPVYLGNRNWHPLFEHTLRTMVNDGVKRAVICFPSGFSCYSSCRQYWENITAAQKAIGRSAPVIEKVRAYYNHPRFIDANIQSVRQALHAIPKAERPRTHLVFTAHSIPETMASCSDYVSQLAEASRLVAAGVDVPEFSIAFQSRSGPPQMAWLGPDINECLVTLKSRQITSVIVLPIAFLTDHMEVKFDLDIEAMETASNIGINMIRADTIGLTDGFVTMLRELIQERMTAHPQRPVLGTFGPHHEICSADCCSYSAQPS